MSIQEILQALYPAYERRHPVAWHVRRAMRKVLRCGTGELGTYQRRCPDGHYLELAGRSCRHRACPRCAWRRGVQWLEGWRERLLPGTHFHIVFTLPSQLHPLWRSNRELFAELLFAAAWHTLRDVVGEPRWSAVPGVLPGVLMALHTWSRALMLHPHVHCLVSAGGIGAQGQWIAIERAILAPGGVLRKVFRGKFLDAVERAWKRGKVALPPQWSAGTMELALRAAANRKWNVRAETPYRHGMGLVIYLARYVCGGAIGERRLVSFDGDAVTFVVGREKEDAATTRVSGEEFVRRLSEHIAMPGQRLTRAYGLYASRQRQQLAAVHSQLRSAPARVPQTSDPVAEVKAAPEACCPVCGKALEMVDLTPAYRAGRGGTVVVEAVRVRGQPLAA